METIINSKGNILSEKVERILYPMLLIAFCLSYSSIYFFNTYPVSEGWNIFNAELLLHGEIPYRDFYYYLPPLNLLVDTVFWKLSFGKLLAYRLWYLFQRIGILLLVYRLFSQFFLRATAFLAVFITSVVITLCVYDLFGDYNQTMALLAVFLILSTTKFAEYKSSKYLFCSGIIIGLMFLNKQPIFVASTICYFITLILFCVWEKDSSFWKYCVITAAGMAILVLPVLFLFAFNGALIPFFEQVFRYVDGKGSFIDLLIINPLRNMRGALSIFVVFAIVIATDHFIGRLPLHCLWIKIQTWPRFNKILCYILTGYVLCMGLALTISEIRNRIILPILVLLRSGQLPLFVLLCVCCSFAVGLIIAMQKTAKDQTLLIVLYCFGSMLSAYYIVKVMDQRSAFLFQTEYFILVNRFIIPLAGTFCFFGLLYCIIKHKSKAAFFLCGAFSLYYAGIMGAGKTNAIPLSVMVAFPLMICITLKTPISHGSLKAFLYGITFSLCTVVVLVGSAQKRSEPYSWWGYDTQMNEKITETSLPAMSGIRVTEDEKEMFEQVTRLIADNTSPEDEIWGYPYIKLFNILSGRFKLRTFVPVLFPDVVAGRYVVQASDLIEKYPPQIILWKTIPNLLETHEEMFQNGEKLKQHELEKRIGTMIREKYSVLGYYNGIEVYGLKKENTPLIYGNIDSIIKTDLTKNEIDERRSRQKVSLLITNPLSFKTRAEFDFCIKPSSSVSTICFFLDNRKIHAITVESSDEISTKIEADLMPGESQLQVVMEYENKLGNDSIENSEIVYYNIHWM